MYDRDRDDQHFDLFYISKSEKGYDDISVHVQICTNPTRCGQKLNLLEQYRDNGDSQKFHLLEMLDKGIGRQKWCLGQCLAAIPTFSFNVRDHALLLSKVLKYHGMNPILCHSIYVGPGVKVELEQKQGIGAKRKVVELFRKICGSETRFRPHAPKKSARLHSLLTGGNI